jgi:hypothetical protein
LVVSERDEVENQDAAQSGIVVLPKMTAPASLNLMIKVASLLGV